MQQSTQGLPAYTSTLPAGSQVQLHYPLWPHPYATPLQYSSSNIYRTLHTGFASSHIPRTYAEAFAQYSATLYHQPQFYSPRPALHAPYLLLPMQSMTSSHEYAGLTETPPSHLGSIYGNAPESSYRAPSVTMPQMHESWSHCHQPSPSVTGYPGEYASSSAYGHIQHPASQLSASNTLYNPTFYGQLRG